VNVVMIINTPLSLSVC